MFRNRINLEPAPAPAIMPRPAPPASAPQAFLVCPVGLSPAQQWLYQKAFAEAQAVARPSILERDLLGCWN